MSGRFIYPSIGAGDLTFRDRPGERITGGINSLELLFLSGRKDFSSCTGVRFPSNFHFADFANNEWRIIYAGESKRSAWLNRRPDSIIAICVRDDGAAESIRHAFTDPMAFSDVNGSEVDDAT